MENHTKTLIPTRLVSMARHITSLPMTELKKMLNNVFERQSFNYHLWSNASNGSSEAGWEV